MKHGTTNGTDSDDGGRDASDTRVVIVRAWIAAADAWAAQGSLERTRRALSDALAETFREGNEWIEILILGGPQSEAFAKRQRSSEAPHGEATQHAETLTKRAMKLCDDDHAEHRRRELEARTRSD